MTALSVKTFTLTAVIVLSSLMSSSAHAGILHTTAGVPVQTAEGIFVQTGVDGESAMPAPTVAQAPKDGCDHERVVLFDFNKSSLTKQARHKLNHLAKKLNAHHEKSLTIVGFSDRVGSVAYNEKLALKRAKTVHDYLVTKGIGVKKIEVRSLGKSVPKADCAEDMPRAKLVECLAEDRRVEIEFDKAK